ncbi:hypothetical protein DL765_011469 [Monosporascus sp. GIB2]|nr:hypothetical protein DL765_011469 [Monosporascus sp. GIB2]
MTADGFSVGIYEHAKLDGIDVRAPRRHTTRALFAQSSIEIEFSPSKSYHSYEHTWRRNPTVMQRMEQIQTLGRPYGLMDHQYTKAEDLSLVCTRDHRAPPEVIAHHTMLLPRRPIDGIIRQTPETVALARLPAPSRLAPDSFAAGACQRAAAALSTTCMRFLECYHPRSAARAGRLAAPFSCRASAATRRGSPGQVVKIGFMPADDPEDPSVRWDEVGFPLHLSPQQRTPTQAPMSGVPGPPRASYNQKDQALSVWPPSLIVPKEEFAGIDQDSPPRRDVDQEI